MHSRHAWSKGPVSEVCSVRITLTARFVLSLIRNCINICSSPYALSYESNNDSIEGDSRFKGGH